jgi:uncharacterized membrane protein YgcG
VALALMVASAGTAIGATWLRAQAALPLTVVHAGGGVAARHRVAAPPDEAALPSTPLDAAVAPATPPLHRRVTTSRAARAPRAFLPEPVVGGQGTWAVVVGIDDYPGTDQDLKGAVNDANDMIQALIGLGVTGDHILRLADGTTQPTLDSALDWLDDNAGPDAIAVFFFAGHARKLADGREAMVMADGGDYTDSRLGAELSRLEARRAWIMMASCYGGGFTEALAPGRILTGAAPANGEAYERSDWNRSELVEYMIRQAIIERQADSSVQAAFDYAHQKLSQTAPGREPVQFDLTNGPLDLRTVPSPPAPPSQGQGEQSMSDAPPPSPSPAGSDQQQGDPGNGGQGGSGDPPEGGDGGGGGGGGFWVRWPLRRT